MIVSSNNSSSSNMSIQFKNNEQDNVAQPQSRSYRFRNHLINAKDIKDPVTIAGTLVGTALLSYLSVQCIAANILSRFAPELSVKIESGIRNTANKIKESSSRLSETKPDGIFSNIKKYTGKAINKIEAGARKLYKGIAYIGLSTMQGKDKTYNAFGNIAGTAAFGITLYKLCTKDSDGDGIKDIIQNKK